MYVVSRGGCTLLLAKKRTCQQNAYAIVSDIPPFKWLPEELMLAHFQCASEEEDRKDQDPSLRSAPTKR
jgi:hypothetical protein